MRSRNVAALLTLIAFVSLPITAFGQPRPPQPRTTRWEPPRTPWGQPDLQGIWNNVTATPLQRPNEFKDKAFLTKEEAAEFAAAGRAARGGIRVTADGAADPRTTDRLCVEHLVRNHPFALGEPHVAARRSGGRPLAAADA